MLPITPSRRSPGSEGMGGLTIARLWALGVLAEIVLFALSPRIKLAPAKLVVIGGG